MVLEYSYASLGWIALVHIISASRDRKLQYESISLGLGAVFKHSWRIYCQVLGL